MYNGEKDLKIINKSAVSESSLSFASDLQTDVYDIGISYLQSSTENSTTDSGKYAGKVLNGLNKVTLGLDIATDIATVGNGNKQEAAETIITAPIKYTAGAVPGIGNFLDFIIADGKNPDGLTNLRNRVLERAYSNSNKMQNAQVYRTITRNVNPNAVANKKRVAAFRALQKLNEIIRTGRSGENHIENYFHENDCFEECND